MARKQDGDVDLSDDTGSGFEDTGGGFEGGDGSVMIDLNSVEQASFEVIPRGTYAATIASCEYGLSQNSGMPMWTTQLEITEGEYEGRKLFNHISFSPKALPFTKKTLAAIAPELLSGPFNPETTASDMEGKAVRVKVSIEKYEGESRNRVKDLLAPAAADAFLG
jgi:hypothetical protein